MLVLRLPDAFYRHQGNLWWRHAIPLHVHGPPPYVRRFLVLGWCLIPPLYWFRIRDPVLAPTFCFDLAISFTVGCINRSVTDVVAMTFSAIRLIIALDRRSYNDTHYTAALVLSFSSLNFWLVLGGIWIFRKNKKPKPYTLHKR